MTIETVETVCYLTCGVKTNGRWMDMVTPKITKGKPKTSANEVAIQLSIKLPKTLFTRPQIEASIQVPADSVVPPVVSMDVVDNIKRIAATEGLELIITTNGGLEELKP